VTELPLGWAATTVGGLVEVVGGGTPSTVQSEYWAGDIPWISSADIYVGGCITFRRFITPEAVRSSATSVVPKGSVIVVTRVGLGKVALARQAMAFSQDSQALLPRKGIDPEFLRLQLSLVARRLKSVSRGTTIAGVTKKQLLELPLALPPLAEQERIVAAIEEQFSRLDAGLAALERVRVRLRTLRDQAILTQVTGVGTRRTLGDVTEIRLGRQRSPKNHSGTYMRPYLRAANITWGGLDLRDVKQMNFVPAELSTYALRRGDVLVSEASGSASEVGKPAIWDESIPNCCFQNTLLRLRSSQLTPGYLYFVLLALARSGTFSRASKGVGIHHLSKAGLAAQEVEVPSIAVQEAIVRKIYAEQVHIGEMTEVVEAQRRRAHRLRSSILAAAFSGKLVPQNPTGEPASILLERIAAERAASNGRQPARKPLQLRLPA
jgi:type I restriction enzyme, S subunit